MASKGRNIDDVDVNTREKARRASDSVDFLKLGSGYTSIRLFGEVYAYGGHWVKTKKKDGSQGTFYVGCSAFDPDTGKRDSTKECAWCKHENAKEEVRFSVDFYTNAIVAKEERNKPEEEQTPTRGETKTGFKQKGSDTWTPVRVLRMPTSVVRSLKDLKELNVHEKDEVSKAFPVSDPRYGASILIRHNESAAPANRYSIQKGDHAPMKAAQRAYLRWDLSDLMDYPTSEESTAEYKRWLEKNGGSKKPRGGVDDEEEEVEAPKRKPRKPVDGDDDDFGDSTPPRRKPKPVEEDEDTGLEDVPKRRRAPVEDEDEEVEVPVRRKRPAPLEEDTDEDVPPPRRKPKPRADDDF